MARILSFQFSIIGNTKTQSRSDVRRALALLLAKAAGLGCILKNANANGQHGYSTENDEVAQHPHTITQLP